MATKRSTGGEIKQIEPKEANPSKSVDALVSDFLTELKSLSSETEEVLPPRAVAEPEIEEEVLSDVDLKRIGHEIEESLIELERLSAADAPAGRKDAEPVPLPPPEPETPAIPPAPREASDSERQELPRLQMFQATAASPGWTKHRRTLLFALPAALLAVIFGSLYLFRTARTTPASKPVAPEPVGTAAFRNEPKQEAPAPKASLPNEAKEATAVAAAKESAPASAGVTGTLLQQSAGTKAKPAAKPSGPAEPRPRPSAPTAAGTGANPPVEQPQPAPQSLAPAPGAVSPPPAPAAAPANASVTPASVPPRETPPASAPPRETPQASAPPRETSPEAPPPSAGTPKAIAVMAEAIFKVQPTYPAMARLQRVDGKVELEADINEKGEVVRAKAVSGPIVLRSAAEEALMKWKFKPASLNGVNIASQARVSVSFNLNK